MSSTLYARVAQWIERFPPEEEVAGSTPAASTNIINKLADARERPLLVATLVAT